MARNKKVRNSRPQNCYVTTSPSRKNDRNLSDNLPNLKDTKGVQSILNMVSSHARKTTTNPSTIQKSQIALVTNYRKATNNSDHLTPELAYS